jgi:hypothetical protein
MGGWCGCAPSSRAIIAMVEHHTARSSRIPTHHLRGPGHSSSVVLFYFRDFGEGADFRKSSHWGTRWWWCALVAPAVTGWRALRRHQFQHLKRPSSSACGSYSPLAVVTRQEASLLPSSCCTRVWLCTRGRDISARYVRAIAIGSLFVALVGMFSLFRQSPWARIPATANGNGVCSFATAVRLCLKPTVPVTRLVLRPGMVLDA